jgi:hypothetical protein
VSVDIPARIASSPGATLQVCARHGERADRPARVVFRSRPPAWTFVLIPLGVLPFAIVATILQKRITSPAWPFCPRCREARNGRVAAGIGLVFLGIVVLVAVSALAPESDFATGFGAAMFVGLLLAGVFLATGSGRAAIAGGYATPDGTAVRVNRSHKRFREQLGEVRQPAST